MVAPDARSAPLFARAIRKSVALEELDDLELTPVSRMLERGDAVLVRDRPVGACGQQDPDDLLMSLAAIAEDDGLEQSGPAEVVDVVDVDARRHDATDVVDVTALRGRDHGHAAEA